MKRRIRLFDKEFEHLNCYCGYDAPENVEWVREGPVCDNGIAIFTERCYDMVDQVDARIKIAWPLEPRSIHNYAYEHLLTSKYLGKFDYVLTFSPDFFAGSVYEGKTIFWTPGGTWIWKKDWAVYPKTQNISMLASDKVMCDGHKFRQNVIAAVSDKLDFFGGIGRKYVENKLDAFKDFRFSIAMENSSEPHYWSDKLLDCLLTGTVPIYYGAIDISKYFNSFGILRFESLEQLQVILDFIEEDGAEGLYESMITGGYIQDNFERAKAFAIADDYIVEQLTEKGIEL